MMLAASFVIMLVFITDCGKNVQVKTGFLSEYLINFTIGGKSSMRNDFGFEQIPLWSILVLSVVEVFLSIGVGVNQQPMFELQVPT